MRKRQAVNELADLLINLGLELNPIHLYYYKSYIFISDLKIIYV